MHVCSSFLQHPPPWYTIHAPPLQPHPFFGFAGYFGGGAGWSPNGGTTPGGFYGPPPPLSRCPPVFHPVYQTSPNTANWFRAAANHFATAAAMFAEEEYSHVPPLPPMRCPVSQPRSSYSHRESRKFPFYV